MLALLALNVVLSVCGITLGRSKRGGVLPPPRKGVFKGLGLFPKRRYEVDSIYYYIMIYQPILLEQRNFFREIPTSLRDCVKKLRFCLMSAAQSSSSSSSASPSDASPRKNAGRSGSSNFECNICFEQAAEPVVTRCGHLFCWSCLDQWLDRSGECPVCKAGVTRENVIPLYGRGDSEHHPVDPRKRPRSRPKGERPPVQPRRNWFGWGGSSEDSPGGAEFSVGAGFPFFPFVYAGYNTRQGPGVHMGVRRGGPEDSAQTASRFFLILAFILLWVILTN